MTAYGIMAPPIEAIGVAYFTPLMAPVPVTTRLGKPDSRADTVVPWLRLEAAGGPLRPDELLYDLSIILHAYAPENLETQPLPRDRARGPRPVHVHRHRRRGRLLGGALHRHHPGQTKRSAGQHAALQGDAHLADPRPTCQRVLTPKTGRGV